MHAPDPQSAICNPRSSIAAAPFRRRRIEAAVAVGCLAFSGLAFLTVAGLFILNPPPARAACNPATQQNCCVSTESNVCDNLSQAGAERAEAVDGCNGAEFDLVGLYPGTNRVDTWTLWSSLDASFSDCPTNTLASRVDTFPGSVEWVVTGADDEEIARGGGTHAAVDDVCGRLTCTFTVHSDPGADCGEASYSSYAATTNAVGLTLAIPKVIGVNDLVGNCADPAGYPAGFVETAEEFNLEDDLHGFTWSACPSSLGSVGISTGDRLRALLLEGDSVVVASDLSEGSAPKLEGVEFSELPGDAVVTLTYAGCTAQDTATVVRVQLDKFCYNRADPYPEVEVDTVDGLAPGGEATVRYRVLPDILGPGTNLVATFTAEEDLGTYEYKTPDYANRLGNLGHDAIRYTVFDNAGTKAVRWFHADPSRKALAGLPGPARMDIELKEALAETPAEALGHLAPKPAFAGPVAVEGARPSYSIPGVKVFARQPNPAGTNEVHAQVGNEEVLQTLDGVARDSAVVLEVAGRRLVVVNDRFTAGENGSDPGDDAAAQDPRSADDEDFVKLTLAGVPDCIAKGSVQWEVTAGDDRARLVFAPGDDVQVATVVSQDFSGGTPGDALLSVHVEGRDASEAIDDVTVTARVIVDDSEDNPRAFRGETLTAEFNLTVTDQRWTGWKADDLSGKTDERTDLRVCDLDLRPAVKIDQPEGGEEFEQGGSLAVSGSVRSMVDIVTDIRVNGETVSLSQIYFLGTPVGQLVGFGGLPDTESLRKLTDRPPPYVVTFEHTVEEFSADELLVEARNGVGDRPGFAKRRAGYEDAGEGQPRSGTLSERLVESPAYDLPDMVEFFDAEGGWEFLNKTEVDHCGAGAGTVECRETCGAQPGDGLFRLRLPVVFVSEKDLNGAIPGPGLFLEDDFSEPLEAKYDNGETVGVRKLFAADLLVAGEDGDVPDVEEWWRGAALVAEGDPGTLTVKNPFDQADLPEDAELTLEAGDIDGQDNPFAGFAPWTRTADTMSGDAEVSLSPVGAGSAAFVLTLSSAKYGLLAKDRVRVGVLRANVLVDSLNQYGFDTPVDSDEVEDVEDVETEPGKTVLVTDGDEDADGIVDYADGFDLFAGSFDDDTSYGVSFVPVVFEIPEPVDVAAAVVNLSYSASDPGAVTTNGLGAYVLPSGHLRLWARDASASRSTNPVWRVVAPGDYLPPTPAGGIPAADLGFSDSQRTLTFYLEAVRPSESQGDQRLVFTVDPDGDGPLGAICWDAARVTAARVESIIVNPKGWPEGQALPDVVSIGVGGIDSDAHQADVLISVMPHVSGIPIGVELERGIGHVVSATLQAGNATAVGGMERVDALTGAEGRIEGLLTSSDSIDVCTIHAGAVRSDVVFSWVTQFDPEVDWLLDPETLPVPGTLVNTVRFLHHRDDDPSGPWKPFDGHEIRFFVEYVEWVGTDGTMCVTTNTPGNPSSEVDNWAVFGQPATTDADGLVSVELTVMDRPELRSVTMAAYDANIWLTPPEESPQPLRSMRSMMAPPPPSDWRKEKPGVITSGQQRGIRPTVTRRPRVAIPVSNGLTKEEQNLIRPFHGKVTVYMGDLTSAADVEAKVFIGTDEADAGTAGTYRCSVRQGKTREDNVAPADVEYGGPREKNNFVDFLVYATVPGDYNIQVTYLTSGGQRRLADEGSFGVKAVGALLGFEADGPIALPSDPPQRILPLKRFEREGSKAATALQAVATLRSTEVLAGTSVHIPPTPDSCIRFLNAQGLSFVNVSSVPNSDQTIRMHATAEGEGWMVTNNVSGIFRLESPYRKWLVSRLADSVFYFAREDAKVIRAGSISPLGLICPDMAIAKPTGVPPDPGKLPPGITPVDALFVFDTAANPGVCLATCETPRMLDLSAESRQLVWDRIEWVLPKVEGQSATGPEAVANEPWKSNYRYSAMPSENDSFVNANADAKVALRFKDRHAWAYYQPVQYRFFRDGIGAAAQHPDLPNVAAGNPNWYVYWQQVAVQFTFGPQCKMEYNSAAPGPDANGFRNAGRHIVYVRVSPSPYQVPSSDEHIEMNRNNEDSVYEFIRMIHHENGHAQSRRLTNVQGGWGSNLTYFWRDDVEVGTFPEGTDEQKRQALGIWEQACDQLPKAFEDPDPNCAPNDKDDAYSAARDHGWDTLAAAAAGNAIGLYTNPNGYDAATGKGLCPKNEAMVAAKQAEIEAKDSSYMP